MIHRHRPAFRSWKTLAMAVVACVLAQAAAAPEPSARASSMVRMDLEALGNGAEHILVGTVEKKESRLSPGGETIVTDVTLDVERSLAGGPVGDRFVVRHLGGEVGGLGQRIYGEASYQPGERVLVFTVGRSGAQFALGMAQGVFHVFNDAQGIARVEAHVADANVLGAPAPATTGPRRLDEVIAQVQSLIARRVAPPVAH
jgi:hypothetical protein